ncbi:hypothetical protein EUGRSUZ_F00259 [Eucalyptus grandis]|uniref:Uncharacterized protein n=2 Tax=Eucalyptus grandis TaxID=71139 RepID=A0ACC3KB67_EUCGR|nr:hypothetical protein EUGRSUZ_F00259 [Eucalyptus grandis]
MERSPSLPLHPPTYGNSITILSIDGGGIRGLIPGTILHLLESELQKLDGKDARIVDYFDVISGTSTGGLVTAMLATPDENNRPVLAAKDIKDLYLNHCPKIFPQDRSLETKDCTKLTNVVIPTFDIKSLQPTIFSSYQLKKDPSMDALLSDIYISTSAAPTYLPVHQFETEDSTGKVREFNLIDGGVAANNPTLVAMGEVTKAIGGGSSDFFPIKPMDYRRFLVISLGTGTRKAEGKYTAPEAAKCGVLGWLTSGGSPLIDVFSHASADMVDYHLSAVFQALQLHDNYLRIQVYLISININMKDVVQKNTLTS